MRSLSVVLLLGAVLLLAPDPASTADDEPPVPVAPEFGAIETYHEPQIADDLGLGWTRIIFYWSELKKDGRYLWNWFHHPPARVDREIAGGREVVGLLQHTPAFATDGSEGAGVPRGLYLPIDDPGNEWAVFVREVTTAYRGRITRWIIWNEPDIAPDDYGTLWEGSIEDYYRLLKVAYLVAHEVDPAIQIHLGGLTYWHNPAYLHDLLDVIAADPEAAEHGYYFDVVSVHLYFKPETTIEIINTLRAALDEHGLDKPIWINETNAPPYDDPAQPWDNPVFHVTQQMQASFLMQEFALALAMGVERIAVYKLIDEPPLAPGFEPYGLIRTDRTPRPAFTAFEVITRHYSRTRHTTLIQRPELFEVVLSREGGLVTRVLWARTPTTLVVEVPALAGAALLIDQENDAVTVFPDAGSYQLVLEGAPCAPGEECLMGGRPLVLVEEALPPEPAAAAARVIAAVPPGEPLPQVLPSQQSPMQARPASRAPVSNRALMLTLGLGAVALLAVAALASRDAGEPAL